MGGTIFVGVRLPDGTEHHSFRWTNCTAWELCDPDFYKDGPTLRAWMDRASRKNADYDKLTTRLHNSSYGIVLVDLKVPGFWEENGYTNFVDLSVATHNSAFANQLAIVVRLGDCGWLGQIWHEGRWYGNPLERTEYLARARERDLLWFERHHPSVTVDVVRKGYEVVHSKETLNPLPRAKQWAYARGWKR